MCGIAGYIGVNHHVLLDIMLQTIKHRGYDETITYSHANIHVGMNRLAIKDLSNGLYPFSFRHLRLVYNGEIYNYPQLRSLLQSRGFTFRTQCDAEVILPLYFLLGSKALNLLDGMFAICIVNTKENSVLLARDKFGEKPLYYSRFQKNNFIFASELKAILAHKSLIRTLNPKALVEYLHHGSSPNEQTLIKEVRKLPAGNYLTIRSDGRSVCQKYWTFNYVPNNFTLKQNLKIIEHKLISSVKSKLVADVPVGTFLSGGVDSSLISAIAAQSNPNLQTFSISFPQSPKNDESYFANKVAHYIGSIHHEITFSEEQCSLLIPEVLSNIDEPIVDPAILPTYLLSKEAKKYVSVILSGEGADEVFAGYYRYIKFLLKFSISKYVPNFNLLSKIKKRLSYYSPQTVWTNGELNLLLHQDCITASNLLVDFQSDLDINDHPLLSLQLADINRYLSEQLLMKIDKMSMLNNLEVRAPYLNLGLVDFVLNTPLEHRLRFMQNKYLLKVIASKYLPFSVVWRPKHGFSVPLESWFQNSLNEPLVESLNYLSESMGDFFNSNYINFTLKSHMLHQSNNANKLWSLMVLSIWMKTHNVKT